MPQSSKFSRKKKRTTNRPWYMRKYNAYELAGKAYSGLKYIKGLVNAEKKTLGIDIGNANILNTGYVQHLSQITQGDTRVSRDGKSVLARGLLLRGAVAATAANQIVRFMVVIDTMNTGTAPTAAEILESTGTVNTPFSPLLNTASGRFKIIHTQLFSLSTVTNYQQIFKRYIPLNKHIKFTGPALTDEWKNQIYSLAVSQDGVTGPIMWGVSQLFFYDN